jgi:hypothetical protein
MKRRFGQTKKFCLFYEVNASITSINQFLFLRSFEKQDCIAKIPFKFVYILEEDKKVTLLQKVLSFSCNKMDSTQNISYNESQL